MDLKVGDHVHCVYDERHNPIQEKRYNPNLRYYEYDGYISHIVAEDGRLWISDESGSPLAGFLVVASVETHTAFRCECGNTRGREDYACEDCKVS